MMAGLFIAAVALLNVVRGQVGGKLFTSFATGFLAVEFAFLQGQAVGMAAAQGLIVFLGVWLWAAPGWGKYLVAIHGRASSYSEPPEIKIVDALASLLIRRPQTDDDRRIWGMAAMGLRALLAAPMFAALGWLTGRWEVALLGLAMPIQGWFYYVMGNFTGRSIGPLEDWRVAVAELATGAWLGVLLTVALG